MGGSGLVELVLIFNIFFFMQRKMTGYGVQVPRGLQFLNVLKCCLIVLFYLVMYKE